jgi:hypothetical protein
MPHKKRTNMTNISCSGSGPGPGPTPTGSTAPPPPSPMLGHRPLKPSRAAERRLALLKWAEDVCARDPALAARLLRLGKFTRWCGRNGWAFWAVVGVVGLCVGLAAQYYLVARPRSRYWPVSRLHGVLLPVCLLVCIGRLLGSNPFQQY